MEENLSIKILTWKTKNKIQGNEFTELKILGNGFDISWFRWNLNDLKRKRSRNIKQVVTGDRFLRTATTTRSLFVFCFFVFCFLWMAHARTIVNFIPTQCTIQSETDMIICDNKSKNFVGNIAKNKKILNVHPVEFVE